MIIIWLNLLIFSITTKLSSNLQVPSFMSFLGKTISHIWFRSNFGFRKLSTLLIGSFLRNLTFLSQMRSFSRNLNHHWKWKEPKKTRNRKIQQKKQKKENSDDRGHNILELYNILLRVCSPQVKLNMSNNRKIKF